jgi:hypothetical protein
MSCTFCGGTSHEAENCWVQFPELKAAYLAKRQARKTSHTATPEEVRSTARDIPLYQMAIGTAQWLAVTTHPEIGYSVAQCAKHCNAPTTQHVEEVINLLQHCQGKVQSPILSGAANEGMAIALVGQLVLDLLRRLQDELGAQWVDKPISLVADNCNAVELELNQKA